MRALDHRTRTVIAVAVLLITASAGVRASDAGLNGKLEIRIQEARSGKTLFARKKAAERLADLTQHIDDPRSVDDKTVADMISLLNSEEDSVRAWVAAALGNLGPRARAAIPKLRELLLIADCLEGDLTSAASIRPALKKMGVDPPPEPSYKDCHNAKGHPAARGQVPQS